MKLRKIPCLVALALGFALRASATAVDFESNAVGTYTSLTYSDFVITAESGRAFDVTSQSPGWPISNHTLITWFQNPFETKLIATFSASNVTAFSIGVGDYNADVDDTHLEVFDASWNLLGSDSYLNPASTYGGDYLSVSTNSAIKYAVFWETGDYPGAVYWDNLAYTASSTSSVPDNSSACALLGLGLGGLALLRRKWAA